MVNDIELINAMVDAFQRIPELTTLLENGADSIYGYIDENPIRNSASKAIYQLPAGSLLVSWSSTSLDRAGGGGDSMLAWVHSIQVFVKACRGKSALEITHALANGVPQPGNQVWRICPLMSGVLGTEIREIVRLIDEEGIDYYVVNTITQETGDYN